MDLTYYILSAVAILITLSIHEFSHAYAAYKLGDNTARNLGRLSINPIKHLDPVGALCMLLFHFGWAKPVPINARNFKNPKKGFAIVAFAGPLSNLIMAFISAFIYLLTYALVRDLTFSSASVSDQFLYSVINNLLQFISIFHSVNIGLGIFNLIPFPPLDGSRLLNVFLPPKAYFGIMRYERYIYWGLIGWLIIGSYVSSFLLNISFVAQTPVLSFIANFISLSNILSSIMNFVSDLIFDFWQLIPFFRI